MNETLFVGLETITGGCSIAGAPPHDDELVLTPPTAVTSHQLNDSCLALHFIQLTLNPPVTQCCARVASKKETQNFNKSLIKVLMSIRLYPSFTAAYPGFQLRNYTA